MGRFGLMVVLAAVLGCTGLMEGGGGPPGVPGLDEKVVSGSRLRPMLWKTDDGLRVPVSGSFFDTQISVECAPVETDRSGIRCVPYTNGRVTAGYFADGSCRDSLGQRGADDTLLLEEVQAGTARLGFRVRMAGGPPTSVFRMVGGSCTDQSGSNPPDGFVLVGSDVTETFAKLTVEHD